jgi:FdhE protein
MPYAAIAQGTKADLTALADTRWASMVEGNSELREAVELQRKLIAPVIELAAMLESRPAPRLSLPLRYLTIKLTRGTPALAGEPVPVPASALRDTFSSLVHVLAEHGGYAAVEIGAATQEGRLDLGALLTLSMRRDQTTLNHAAARAGLAHDVLWLVSDLTVGPFAHRLLTSMFDAAPPDGPVSSALDGWSWGHCPLCGSWPAFAEQLAGGRWLRCSFCAAAWRSEPVACIYCGKENAAPPTSAETRQTRVIDACGACRGYLKVIPAERMMPFPLLALTDLESMDMDMIAMQQGFARPPIRPFRRS